MTTQHRCGPGPRSAFISIAEPLAPKGASLSLSKKRHQPC